MAKMKTRVLCMLLIGILAVSLLPAAIADTADETHYLDINEANFPDEYFRNHLHEFPHRQDLDEDGSPVGDPYMTKEQVESITDLSFGASVRDFTGLQWFTELKLLSIGDEYFNEIPPIEVKNLNLGSLTKLQVLVLSRLTNTRIDLSKQTNLLNLEIEQVALKELDLSANTALTMLRINDTPLKKLDLSAQTDLKRLELVLFKGTAIDLSNNIRLTELYMDGCKIRSLDVSACTLMKSIGLAFVPITEIDVHALTKLEGLRLDNCSVKELDLTANDRLGMLLAEEGSLEQVRIGNKKRLTDVLLNSNHITELEIGKCPNLQILDVRNNSLTELDLSGCKNVYAQLDGQARAMDKGFKKVKSGYTFSLKGLVSDYSRVSFADDAVKYDKTTGKLRVKRPVYMFTYQYDTGAGEMDVKITVPFTGKPRIRMDKASVPYLSGKTPYVVYNGFVQEPAVVVTDEAGTVLDPSMYTLTYRNNKKPGTATVTATFKNTGKQCSTTFKIFLAATGETDAVNIKGGIRVTWKAVKGAKGYVVQRSVRNAETGKWSAYKTVKHTGKTGWTDTDVAAGTQYRYKVKAYFAEKTDPDTGATIGGPSDKGNLGLDGPVKKQVRITTRTIRSLTAGKERMTVKWKTSRACTGYQVQYSRDKAFTTFDGNVRIKDASVGQTTITDLCSDETYYVRVRSFLIVQSKTYYGQWSKVVSVTIDP